MLAKGNAQVNLEAHGFTLQKSNDLLDNYELDLGNGWIVSASCSFEGNPFMGQDVDKDTYSKIDIHLGDLIGTSHIFDAEKPLERNLAKVIEILRCNSNDEVILKCPKCNDLYVTPKIPTSQQSWKPFLSCRGMQMVGSGKNKGILCNGVSSGLPAVVHYH